MSFKPKACKCGGWHSSMVCPLKKRKPMQAKKRLKKKGKQQIEYEKWRDDIAKPFLDEFAGHICSVPDCEVTEYLQVDHIRNRGSRADLKMNLENVQYLCNTHHQQKTYREKGSIWASGNATNRYPGVGNGTI